MTTFLPLDATVSCPSAPGFLIASPDPASQVKRIVKAILGARRIVVVCGAGISVEAGIPDFRSSEGLFESLKNDHPKIVSGKDLFDVAVFKSADTISLFCKMIARLSQLSEAAEPTKFHRLLRVLDDRRRLLRVYTQNIDGLEEKSGLTFGVPGTDSKGNGGGSRSTTAPVHDATTTEATADIVRPKELPASRTTSRAAKIPKCIPLHGTLQLMNCVACTHSYPLPEYIESLTSGTLPPCPQCAALEETRRLLWKRSRCIGRLRPSVVLYNEDHKDGEAVGSVVWKDLTGCLQGQGRSGADLLLVVGTSLRVSGTKRIVKEFSKALRSTMNAFPGPSADETTLLAQGLVAQPPPPHSPTATDTEPAFQTIYLNLDFPVPTGIWEGVFDVWIQGDAQAFAEMVHEELEKEKGVGVKQSRKQRKRKRDDEA